MKPYKANIYIYANNADEVAEFERVFYDFVNFKRQQGIAVSAHKMTLALSKFKDNFFLNNFLTK